MDTHNLNAYQYRMTQLLEAQIEMEAMKAQNQYRTLLGEHPEYKFDDFYALINKHGIHHNAAVEAGWKIME